MPTDKAARVPEWRYKFISAANRRFRLQHLNAKTFAVESSNCHCVSNPVEAYSAEDSEKSNDKARHPCSACLRVQKLRTLADELFF